MLQGYTPVAGTEYIHNWAANQGRSKMKSPQLSKSRFIVGVLLVVVAVLMFLFVKNDYSIAGSIPLGVLDMISIAISRRK